MIVSVNRQYIWKRNNIHEFIWDLRFLFVLFPLLIRLHAYRLRAVLRLHQVCHRTEWTLPWVERCSAAYRCPIQARSKVWHQISSCVPTNKMFVLLLCFAWSSDLLKVMFGSHRYLEEGNLEMASSEKQRIEDLQRTRRKWREENDAKQEPSFFK